MIGNKNTKVRHNKNCKALGMMREKNMVNPDQTYEPCKWCGGNLDYVTDNKPCLDKYYIGKADRCVSCNSTNGVTMMYPDKGGYKVDNEPERQQIIFHCFDCEKDSLLAEILNHRIAKYMEE